MKNEPLIIERTYNAPAERVWQAITVKEKMKQWYFDLPEFQPRVGAAFTFEGCSESETYIHLCRVTDVQPGKLISYTWSYQGYPGESKVTFEIFPEGDRTRLKLTHEGLETFPQDRPDFAKSCFEAGWTDFIGNALKEFVEKESVHA